MKYKWIIGNGNFLEITFHSWKQAFPEEAIEKIDIQQHFDYNFDFSHLEKIDSSQGSAFVALDERFGNFKRIELMQAVLERGFKLATFIHPTAVVCENTDIGINTFIGANTFIGHDCTIGYNTVINPGSHISHGCRIKPSCWIESGVQLDSNVELGSNSILRTGTIVRRGIRIGKSCELGWPKVYTSDIPNKTAFDIRYDNPIFVYET